MTLAPGTADLAVPTDGADGLAAAPDAELARRARGGDRAAAEELARRCRRPAYLLALQLLRDPDDALDVAQDALLRLFTHLDRVDPERPLRPWLAAIVRNRARDLMRRRRVRRHESLDTDPEDRPARVLVDPAAGPEERAARTEAARRLWGALGQLAEAQREILVLRDYQDLAYEEIAAVLGVPLGTVMSRLHRARRALRTLLEGAGAPPGGRA